MADLKSLFEEMGFTNIKTYIQSGNVIFTSNHEEDHLELSNKLEKAINDKFGFEVPVIIRTSGELEYAVNQNPFYKGGMEIAPLHLTFLDRKPTPESQQQTEVYNYEPDKFVIKGENVFIFCESKYHKTKLTNNFFEKKLKVKATTRNWKTVLKLLELSKEQVY